MQLTHCKHGHEYTPENTYTPPRGRRSCRECQRIRQRRPHAPRKTHCKRGHEYTSETVLITTSGSRQCKTCANLIRKQKRVVRDRKHPVPSGPRVHTEPWHGTPEGYDRGCRCDRCKIDHAVVDVHIVRAIACGRVLLSEVPPLNRKEQTMLKRLREEQPPIEQGGRIATVGRGQLSRVGLGAWDWRR